VKYFLSAGEASGDLHASQLINALRLIDRSGEFTFLGGDLMAEAVGKAPAIHYRRMAYMGFSEVMRHLPEILTNLSTAKKAIRDYKPDAVILVDYPSFNFKLAKEAVRLGIPVYYYIAPKVWAWKEWRVKTLRALMRHIYCILPFEVEYFHSKGLDNVTYVGNPSLEEVDRKLAQEDLPQALIPYEGKKVLALVPGSRLGEIRANLPVMETVAKRHPDMTALVSGAPSIPMEVYSQYTTLPIVTGCTLQLMRMSTAALVTSGTATLECALAGTPQVACYRSSGSKAFYNIMKHFIKAPFVTLPNLIAGREVIPEMLMHMCATDPVDAQLCRILPGQPGRQEQLDGYSLVRERLATTPAAATTAALLYKDLLQSKS